MARTPSKRGGSSSSEIGGEMGVGPVRIGCSSVFLGSSSSVLVTLRDESCISSDVGIGVVSWFLSSTMIS